MGTYHVVITQKAEDDLWELRNYITDILMSPETAKKYIRDIRSKIESLAEFPARYKMLEEESWHLHNVHKLIAKNFFAYYMIDDTEKRVYVIHIIYRRRDQINAMTGIKPY